MSLTQLPSYYLPALTNHSSWRKLRIMAAMMQRQLKARARKARSLIRMYARQQYYLTTALGDMRTSAARNEDIFITAVICTAIIGFSFAATATNAVLLFLATAYDLAEITGASMGLLMLIVCGVLTVIGGWLASFVLNMQSLAIMDGARRKVHRSVRSTIRNGLRYASRVASAWIALLSLITLPLLLTAVPCYLYLRQAANPISALTDIVPVAAVSGISWIVLVMLNFSLAPYVSLFEPQTTLKAAFVRSHQLVKRRGRLFILGGYILLTTAIYGAYMVAILIENSLGLGKNLTFFMGAFSIVMLANGVMVSLYRKRSLARKN